MKRMRCLLRGGLGWAARVAAGVLLALLAVLAGFVWWTMPSGRMGARYPMAASAVDFDADGVDDYRDIVQGARADAEAWPVYDSGYYEGGYPPEGRGACTDTVWRAFARAGYDLKAMVDRDVAADPRAYAGVVDEPDPNIDFRRAGVLDVFFRRYARELSCDADALDAWQGGDVVVFGNGSHIGIVSDRRDRRGKAFVIHNMGQLWRENDYLAYPFRQEVTGHYRFDASAVPAEVLAAWHA